MINIIILLMYSFLLIGLTSFLLGLRHGIDWDHIAAITDIVGAIDDKRKSFLNGSMYIFGHAFVIICLGILAVVAGLYIPKFVDSVMEPIVGVTLIILGIWLVSSVVISGKHYKMQSKWMLLFKGFSKLYNHIHKKFAHKHNLPHIHYPETFTPISAFIIGVIHGIGAETPTQVVLFSTAAGVKGGFLGTIILLLFVLGLTISNLFITLMVFFGHSTSHKNPWLHLGLGLIGGMFSIIIGTMFLIGKSSFLPALIGG